MLFATGFGADPDAVCRPRRPAVAGPARRAAALHRRVPVLRQPDAGHGVARVEHARGAAAVDGVVADRGAAADADERPDSGAARPADADPHLAAAHRRPRSSSCARAWTRTSSRGGRSSGRMLVLVGATWLAIRVGARLFRVGLLNSGARPTLARSDATGTPAPTNRAQIRSRAARPEGPGHEATGAPALTSPPSGGRR